jgi:hypothetical protein
VTKDWNKAIDLLAKICDRFHAGELEDYSPQMHANEDPKTIVLVRDHGGTPLLTLQDCMEARKDKSWLAHRRRSLDLCPSDLREEIRILEEALQYYSDPQTWSDGKALSEKDIGEEDWGRRATEALNKVRFMRNMRGESEMSEDSKVPAEETKKKDQAPVDYRTLGSFSSLVLECNVDHNVETTTSRPNLRPSHPCP